MVNPELRKLVRLTTRYPSLSESLLPVVRQRLLVLAATRDLKYTALTGFRSLTA